MKGNNLPLRFVIVPRQLFTQCSEETHSSTQMIAGIAWESFAFVRYGRGVSTPPSCAGLEVQSQLSPKSPWQVISSIRAPKQSKLYQPTAFHHLALNQLDPISQEGRLGILLFPTQHAYTCQDIGTGISHEMGDNKGMVTACFPPQQGTAKVVHTLVFAQVYTSISSRAPPS
jgi:hypothetical protein